METAKVDIRKLQLLNDRINQTIDALSQVRLSVHGLSHSQGINPNAPNVPAGFFGAGAGQQQGFPQVPQVGFPQVQAAGFPQLFGGGLSHSPMLQGSFQGGLQGGMNPYAAWGVAGGLNPYAGFGGGVQQAAGLHPYAGAAGWNPYAAQLGAIGGLSHTTGAETFEATRPGWADPLLAVRVAQTFPYAQFALPPVVTLY